MAIRIDQQEEPLEGLSAELEALLAASGGIDETVPASAPPERRRGFIMRRALVFADAIGLVLALLVTQTIFLSPESEDVSIYAMMALGLVGWVLLARLYGFYSQDELRMARSTADDFPGLLLLTTMATWLGLLALELSGVAQPKIQNAAVFWILSLGFVLLLRAVARSLVQRRWMPREPTIIVGAGKVGHRIADKLALRPEYGLEVVGFVDDDPFVSNEDGPPYLGGTRRLEEIIRTHRVQRVIVAFSRLSADQQVEIFRRAMSLGAQVDIVPRMFEVIGSRTQVHDLDGLPLISLAPPRLARSSRFMKRALDVCISATALVMLSPLFAFCAWRIKAASPGPVFFRQERMGAGGRRFRIFKFRSMYMDADERKREYQALNKHDEVMFKIVDDPRITPIGKTLRKYSLDELPQLINVLRGEMSLVGPRPLILDEDRHIVGHHRRRLDLTPGVTGLWQVLGRSDIPFDEMITLDYLYVTNWTLWGDLKLLWRTVPAVARGRGAY